ncbi:immunity 52 family protein [Paraburkholderia sp. ZP32-5]|uniref:immunity 52 family protein n=1 Tax=Paraburkholderia sp. ZP32-5 TaxID=2883245 RepID=UPI001F167BCA|nr:immunity 52 family protein [Paraburkholderia sp. ZP32-5]
MSTMEINTQFRDTALSPIDFESVLFRLGKIIEIIGERQPELRKDEWYLKGQTQKEARLYRAFDADAASTAAIAVLKESFRNSPDQTYVGIWAHPEGSEMGGSMTCHIGPSGELNSLAVSLTGEHALIDFDAFTQYTSCVADEFNPIYAEVSPAEYFEKRVFDDKPGVGWMLYLPKVVTVQQVPEARALIPVPGPGREQTGTIIVSVTDAVFSVDNTEHVEVANRIEIRLVDQDLLPSYAEL